MSQNRWNELPQPDRNKSFQMNQGGHPVLPPPQALAQPQGMGGDREQYYLPSIQNQNGNMRYPLPSIRENVPYIGNEIHQGMSRMEENIGQSSPQVPQAQPQQPGQQQAQTPSTTPLTPQQPGSAPQQPAPQQGPPSGGSAPAIPQQLPQQAVQPPPPQSQQSTPQVQPAQPPPQQPQQQIPPPPQQPQQSQQPAQHTPPQQPQQPHTGGQPQPQAQQPPAPPQGAQQQPQQHSQPPTQGQQPQQQPQPGQGPPGQSPFEQQQFPLYQYGQVAMQQPMFPPADYRPLNVRDALSYLEKVKIQFAKQPDVYNHFLDIMKDFKSQAIDTPGVIDRVSSLFRGHTNLIQGFNTFLPAGYSIECSLDPLDPNPIRVTTPMGGSVEDFERWRYDQQQQQQQQPQVHPVAQQPQQQPQQHLHHAPLQTAPAQPHQPHAHVPGAETDMNQLHAAAVDGRRQTGPAEFNYVFSYVNKIKKRYASQPDIYNSFLEILQAYKREQLRISEVYSQVKQLFGDAPDLLEDFKHFLPDRSVPSPENGAAPYDQVRLPPVGNFSTASSVSYDAGPTAVAAGAAQQPIVTAPVAKKDSPHHISMAEEINFFDKVRKALPKQTYLEFLKVINLFSQRIIDLNTLVERVDGFIGQQPELIEWFKSFVGYEGKPIAIENIAARKHVVDLSQCRSCGPSYRLLPKSETILPSSGRDEMCWEVLNDEWVGHPTWASEDSGFVAHRKNQYEEILYRIEEERHEYDHFIGSNQRTIQVLETIANRIANMTLEEQAEFKLPPGLGQKSKIYQKVVNKIYDKKNGAEVIEALHENPAVAVPIILRRLKQKDEEWKRAQREWNKVWRETEQKVFYKSLDHIGLTFKQADRKQLTARAIVGEIVAVKAEIGARRKTAALPQPKSQISFTMKDEGVLVDLWRLVAAFTENGGNYSQNDREQMNNFLKSFLPLFFGLDPSIVDQVYPSAKRPATTSLDGVLKKSKQEAAQVMDQDESMDVDEPGADREDTSEAAASLVKEGEAPWLKFERGTPPLEEQPSTRHLYNLFGNTALYLFMRLLQTIYERLLEVKNYEAKVSEELKVDRTTRYANDLHLYDTKLDKLGLLFNPEDCYGQVLTLCRRQIEGELEAQLFEEALRQAYRNRAYKLYTIDKSLNALVKQLHVLITDQTCGSIVLCYEHDRKTLETDVKRQILYRMQVRQLLGPEETMFRIDWDDETKDITFQHLGSSDLSLKGVAEAQKKWDYYVTSYMMSVPTEGIPFERIKAPLLSKSTEVVTEDPFAVISQDLSARICMNTYKLFFEPDTCDYLVRVVEDKQAAQETAHSEREKRWREVLDYEREQAEADDDFERWFNNKQPEVQESSLRDEPMAKEPSPEQPEQPQPEQPKQAEAEQPEAEQPEAEKPEAEKPEAEKPDAEKLVEQPVEQSEEPQQPKELSEPKQEPNVPQAQAEPAAQPAEALPVALPVAAEPPAEPSQPEPKPAATADAADAMEVDG